MNSTNNSKIYFCHGFVTWDEDSDGGNSGRFLPAKHPDAQYVHVTGKLYDARRATVAFDLDGNFGVSICSEKDNFDKRLGRIRSEGRLKSYQYRQGMGSDALVPAFTNHNVNLHITHQIQEYVRNAKNRISQKLAERNSK